MTALQEYLKNRRLKQGDFAVLINSTQGAVSKLASGVSQPSPEMAVAIERHTCGIVKTKSWPNFKVFAELLPGMFFAGWVTFASGRLVHVAAVTRYGSVSRPFCAYTI